MALHKVPGSKGKYKADDRGLKEIGMSAALGDLSEVAALRGAAIARQLDPEGEYTVERRNVMAGYPNAQSLRAGAVVRQVKAGPQAMQGAVMRDVLAAMEAQRGSSRIPGR